MDALMTRGLVILPCAAFVTLLACNLDTVPSDPIGSGPAPQITVDQAKVADSSRTQNAADPRVGTFVPNRLLVKFKPGTSQTDEQRALVAANARVASEIPHTGVKIVNLPAGVSETAQARAFGAQANVEFAEFDSVVPHSMVPNDPYYNNIYYGVAWHLPKIGCPQAWDTTTGSSSVIIAILDTGCEPTHPDLVNKFVPGWNFYDNNSNTSDVYGHGTAVAGQAAAESNNGFGVASPACGCKLMPLRISDLNGNASFSTAATAVTWAADHGARVANISYIMTNSSAVTSAAQYMQSKGGVVTVSAGNYATFDSAADNPYVLTISATDQNDVLASWSNTGNNVDLSAPGVSIYTTTTGGRYGCGTGTSCSAPIVAGVAALVMSVNPSLTATQVQNILKQSADDLGPAGWDPSYGAGRVNAARAVQMAAGASSPPPDTTPPTDSFATPLGGSIVSGTVSLQVSATDNVGVASVSLYLDGALQTTLTAGPYNFSWNTSLASNGGHTLSAIARDAAGNSSTAQISVSVNNPDMTAPTVAFSAPASGASVSGTVSVQVSAADNVGVDSVSLSVDGVLVGTDTSSPYTFTWNTATASNGSHTLLAVAADAAGNTTSTTISASVNNPAADMTPPVVAIVTPTSGATVSGNVSVKVNTSDNVGVSRVELYVDGALKATSTTAPFTTTWNARKAPVGTHTLQCKAYDAAGNAGTSTSVAVNR